jgi:hypothetical protein
MNSRTAADETTIAALVFIDIGFSLPGKRELVPDGVPTNIISSFDAGFMLFAAGKIDLR